MALLIAIPLALVFSARLLIVGAAVGGIAVLSGHTFFSGAILGIVLGAIVQEVAIRWWRRRRPDLFAKPPGDES